jgi:hypothetical protein
MSTLRSSLFSREKNYSEGAVSNSVSSFWPTCGVYSLRTSAVLYCTHQSAFCAGFGVPTSNEPLMSHPWAQEARPWTVAARGKLASQRACDKGRHEPYVQLCTCTHGPYHFPPAHQPLLPPAFVPLEIGINRALPSCIFSNRKIGNLSLLLPITGVTWCFNIYVILPLSF